MIIYGHLQSSHTGESVWGPPRMFPPGEPKFPAKLRTPDQPLDDCPASCVDLKLEYNPNEEGPETIFECDTPLNFGESNTAAWPNSRLNEPVKLETTNRCHLFCDSVSINFIKFSAIIDILIFQMLISITECRGGGIWTGRPDLGYWCNTEPTNAALTSNTKM